MRALKTQSEPELLIPSLRTTATIITILTAAFLVAIIASHLLRDDSSQATVERSAVPEIHQPAGAQIERAASYPYTDPRTVGLY
jgi:hypothetical protein